MNSFRSAILSGKGLKGDPVVHQKKVRTTKTDDLTSVGVPRSETRSCNQREEDRHRLDHEAATARHDEVEHQVELVNLSGGGAMIRADFKPMLWDRVDLVLAEGGEIECAVRWLRDDRIGLEFAHETKIDCDPVARDALLLDVIHRSFPDVALAPREEPPAPQPVSESDDDEADASSRRAEGRHPLVWKGEVFYNHDSEPVRLRNISEHGALIESPASYPIGAEVLIDLGEAGQHFATVSWTRSDKVGLKFARPFDLKLLGSAKPEVAPEMLTRPGPSRLSEDQDNPWAEGWHRQSLEELRDDLEGYLKR